VTGKIGVLRRLLLISVPGQMERTIRALALNCVEQFRLSAKDRYEKPGAEPGLVDVLEVGWHREQMRSQIPE